MPAQHPDNRSELSPMQQTRCTVVMYHYVRDAEKTPYPGIKGISIKAFVEQISYLQRAYKIISLDQYLGFLKGEENVPTNAAILSFDDGLKDHYSHVFPILRERQLPACFYPLTAPLTEGWVQPVQKIHFLLAKISTGQLAEEFNFVLGRDYPDRYEQYAVTDRAMPDNPKRWGTPLERNLKYTVGQLDAKTKNAIVDELFCKVFEDERALCREIYLTWEEMREMSEGGMTFGGHTHSHPMLGRLSLTQQREELQRSKEILEAQLGTQIRHFSYPYGSFNSASIRVLKELGYESSVAIQAEVNQGRQVNPFIIKRVDTNDIPSAGG